MSFHFLAEAITKAERFYIVTHRDPDGDAIGSAGALMELLRLLGKEAWLILEKPLDPGYKILLDLKRVITIHPNDKECHLLPSIDRAVKTLVIGVDYHDPVRLGSLIELMKDGAPLSVSNHVSRAIIDHHKPSFVDHELACQVIDPSASNCGVLIYRLFKKMGMEINLPAARCLYWAVVSDTVKFSVQSTCSYDLEVAAECLKKGVDFSSLQLNLEERFESSYVQRAMRALMKARRLKRDAFWVMELPFDSIHRAGSGPLRWIHTIMPGLKEPIVWVVMLEESPGKWRFSARSRQKLKLGEFFSRYGGGGHEAAAGCTVSGSPSEVVEALSKHVEMLLA